MNDYIIRVLDDNGQVKCQAAGFGHTGMEALEGCLKNGSLWVSDPGEFRVAIMNMATDIWVSFTLIRQDGI